MSRLIDADALFNWGKYKLSDAVKYGNKDAEQQHFSYSTLMMYEIADEIFEAPTVELKRGEWKKGKDFPSCPRVKFISDAYYCSVCENEAFYDTDYGQQLFNFCPNCGADMRKNEKE
jgi:hypothetical protein